MANYTPNLNLEKPLQTENYDVDVFNDNFDKIDNFAGQIPARALTADKLTVGAKINNVLFNGTTDIEIPIGMTIGSIIPVVCSSNYVPDNCLPCDGTEYAKTQFDALWTNYLANGNLVTCSYADYSAEISANGFCAKFAIDTINNKFKVPTLNNIVYQGHSSTASVKGNGKSLGLTDGTNVAGLTYSTSWGLGVAENNYNVSVGTTNTITALGNTKATGITADGTKSGIVTDLSAVKDVSIRYFVVVANGSINQAQMDWAQWASSLAGKQNIGDWCVTSPTTTPSATLNKPAVMVDNYKSGTDGYVVFSDGLTYQWGWIAYNTSATINLKITMADTDYMVFSNRTNNSGDNVVFTKTTTTIKPNQNYGGDWMVVGYKEML